MTFISKLMLDYAIILHMMNYLSVIFCSANIQPHEVFFLNSC